MKRFHGNISGQRAYQSSGEHRANHVMLEQRLWEPNAVEWAAAQTGAYCWAYLGSLIWFSRNGVGGEKGTANYWPVTLEEPYQVKTGGMVIPGNRPV